ncbi:hypothetical protein AB4Y32_37815 [Paraburkholderia phymatum]|uniref:Uncharacterized protein n=1 Tax=Paraburkholderia phymatum TaxID=148447 RepID=A0ACC6UCM0_9BURK
MDSSASTWLTRYPAFRDALHHGATRFGALPLPAKMAAMRRTHADAWSYHGIAPYIDDVAASYVEMFAHQVDEAVTEHLAAQFGDGDEAKAAARAQLDALAREVPVMRYPAIARPPCLLSTGNAVIMEGWMRYFFYRARGDTTIPLLAVDWPRFDAQLQLCRA